MKHTPSNILKLTIWTAFKVALIAGIAWLNQRWFNYPTWVAVGIAAIGFLCAGQAQKDIEIDELKEALQENK